MDCKRCISLKIFIGGHNIQTEQWLMMHISCNNEKYIFIKNGGVKLQVDLNFMLTLNSFISNWVKINYDIIVLLKQQT